MIYLDLFTISHSESFLLCKQLDRVAAVVETYQRQGFFHQDLTGKLTGAKEVAVQKPRHHSLVHIDLKPHHRFTFSDVDRRNRNIALIIAQNGPFSQVQPNKLRTVVGIEQRFDPVGAHPKYQVFGICFDYLDKNEEDPRFGERFEVIENGMI